ncbi:hypothetical protein BH23CHL5_BH23CHL5_21600 [soil metagenome]
MGRRFLSYVGVASLALIVLTACGSQDQDEPEPTVTRVPDAANAPVLPDPDASPIVAEVASPVVAAVEGTPGESVATAGEAAIEIVSLDIRFEPAELTIPADTAVSISLPNEGAAPHNFSIDELDIDIDQAPGAVESVEINAPAGTYEFYCNVPGHREAGMVGRLTVE